MAAGPRRVCPRGRPRHVGDRLAVPAAVGNVARCSRPPTRRAIALCNRACVSSASMPTSRDSSNSSTRPGSPIRNSKVSTRAIRWSPIACRSRRADRATRSHVNTSAERTVPAFRRIAAVRARARWRLFLHAGYFRAAIPVAWCRLRWSVKGSRAWSTSIGCSRTAMPRSLIMRLTAPSPWTGRTPSRPSSRTCASPTRAGASGRGRRCTSPG